MPALDTEWAVRDNLFAVVTNHDRELDCLSTLRSSRTNFGKYHAEVALVAGLEHGAMQSLEEIVRDALGDFQTVGVLADAAYAKGCITVQITPKPHQRLVRIPPQSDRVAGLWSRSRSACRTERRLSGEGR
jgi:hypothetical protein